MKSIENSSILLETFFNAYNNPIYLKDEDLKYILVNRSFENFVNKDSAQIIGHYDSELMDEKCAEQTRDTDLRVLNESIQLSDLIDCCTGLYKVTKFPVRLQNGNLGVGGYFEDITKERENERKQNVVLNRHMILADVLSRSFATRQEQLDYVLHQALKMTESEYGYIYLYDEEKRQFTLNSWTKGVMGECAVAKQQSVYDLDKTGIWGEVVRQRKPLVLNNFAEPNPLKKGYPKGHLELKKFMSVPVIIDEKIVAVIGFGNKQDDYDDDDVYEMTLLMLGVWHAVERREAEERLYYERNKYLQTLVSIGDGVMVVGRDRSIEMLNTVAQKLTGWTQAEAAGKNYKEVFVLSHVKEDCSINDPIEDVFTTNSTHELGNHAVLTSRDGTQVHLEDSASPILDEKGVVMGVVLVFRDVTEKMQQRNKIEYLSFHDSLTGLYNRRYFEEEMHRIDTYRNLPISIAMGDVNGLKLTNDIFGHAAGDVLLQRISAVIKNCCRADDIIARWGGDEFVVLLPKTYGEEAEKVADRIKKEFAKEKIEAVRGSVSIGVYTKSADFEDIMQALHNAEQKMYLAKTLERDTVQSGTINEIIATLYEMSEREKWHSIRVCEWCEAFGKALGLDETKMRRLKDAGYLHDIGKVVLDPKLLNKDTDYADYSEEEWNEVKRHPIMGYRILNAFDNTLDLAEPILAHQERWNGTGYPKGLKGDEIPLIARVLSIVESFERMMFDADNKPTLSVNEAACKLEENAGILYDPQIVELFVKMVRSNADGGQ